MARRKRMWVAGKKTHPICCPGPPDNDVCHNLSLLEAHESPFHDPTLMEATREINGIFDRLRPAAPPSTHLALLNTGLGLLLVWAEAEGRNPGGGVTYDSDDEEIRRELKLPPERVEKGA